MKLHLQSRNLSRALVAVYVACALAAVLPVSRARAANVAWADGRFVYVTNGSSVADVLNAFASSQHLPVRIDGAVDGVVSGRFSMPPPRFLDMLAKSYGFVWYYDGAVLQVSSARAQKTAAFRPNVLAPGDLATALQEAGVVDAHFPLVVDNAAHTVDVVGPATYVARVRAAAERFERDAGKRVRTAVRVFRLSVANAADKTRVVDGRSLVVPGAATLLRRRFEPAAPPELIELGTRLPAIEADETTNSILIRDTPERIDADGVLVADLDVAPRVVSVQAWVVDLDADALDRLQSALPPAWAHAADGGVPSSFGVAPDGGRALLAQIRALAKDRHARIEVSQTLLTQDRTPAVIDRHEARLAQREDDDSQEDPALDLWLSVQPVVASAGHIGLDVELGRRDDTQHYLRVDEPVAAGECLVIAAPGETSADAPAPARLVLLVPRIAA